MKTKISLLLNLLLISTLSFGAIHTVTNTNADGDGSLAGVYEAAADGDTIAFNVDAESFTLPIAVDKGLTIDGLNQFNSSKMILKRDSISYISIIGKTMTLKNLIFDGEGIAGEIGILADNTSTLNMESCIFKNISSASRANNGSAARIQGIANINNCLFENNVQGTGTYGGGAICIYNAANVNIENSSFVGNKGQRGGAINAHGTAAYSLTVTNTTFANNEAEGSSNARGGAVYLTAPTALEVNAKFINCTFTGNYAKNNGGGLCAFASSGKKIYIDLINCIIAYNKTGNHSDIDVWNLDSRVFFKTASNCIYGTAAGGAAGIVWTNSIQPADINLANIFEEIEDWTGSFKRPVLKSVSGQKIAAIPQNSIAKGAGIATLIGFTIPTEDQIGYDRPATPSIGAVEYHIPTGVSNAVNTELKMMTKDKVISFTGLSGVSPVAVYGLTGNLLHQSLVGNNQEISLDHLSDNLVIVRIDNKSFKAFLK